MCPIFETLPLPRGLVSFLFAGTGHTLCFFFVPALNMILYIHCTIVWFQWYECNFKSVVLWSKDVVRLKNCDEGIHKATLIFLLINWYKLFAWKMISTSKQDLHDFPDLSPPSAAQLLINAKDYANHRNHHCITSSRKERIKIESSSKIVMLSLDFMSSVCVDYFVFSTYSYIGPRATIPTDLWNCSNFHFLRVIGVDG